MSVIVVGVDGSEPSKEALHWALGEARLRQATLRAIYAWLYPNVGGRGYIPPELLDRAVLSRSAQAKLDAAVTEVAGTSPGVDLERTVVEGPTARVLVEAGEEAELLVVGSRGHGGLAGLLLGSVSQQCVHHAACPVVIVHPPKPTGGGAELGAAAKAESPVAA
jgi:nucleotide-binding universal stress UspA family protein